MSELTVGSLSGLAANGFVIDVASGSKIVQPGAVLQVVQVVETGVFSQSIGAAAISAEVMTASITPTSTSSKVLVQVTASCSVSGTSAVFLVLNKGGSPIAASTGDSVGSRSRVSSGVTSDQGERTIPTAVVNFLDSPATTSAVTYSFTLQHGSGSSRTVFLNRAPVDDDSNLTGRAASSITLMEVAG